MSNIQGEFSYHVHTLIAFCNLSNHRHTKDNSLVLVHLPTFSYLTLTKSGYLRIEKILFHNN